MRAGYWSIGLLELQFSFKTYVSIKTESQKAFVKLWEKPVVIQTLS